MTINTATIDICGFFIPSQ